MILTVTGHRPNKLYGYDLNNPKYKKLYNKIYDVLVREKPSHCISGMALGVDTIFACAVLNYKKENPDVILECAIPCRNHSSRWNKKDTELYNRILKLADKVTLVTHEAYKPYLMEVRNRYMIDKANKILAIWNGDENGGTYNAVKYSKKKDKEMIYIDPSEI